MFVTQEKIFDVEQCLAMWPNVQIFFDKQKIKFLNNNIQSPGR